VGLESVEKTMPPEAGRTVKRTVRVLLPLPLADAYDYAGGVMAQNMMAQDVAEGIDAFTQKRPPVWRGC